MNNQLQAVRVLFSDKKYNYSTSVSCHSTQKDLKDYFIGSFFNMGSFPTENMKQCTDIVLLKQNKKVSNELNKRLICGVIYYPDSNLRKACFIDPLNMVAVGFDDSVYHPCGGGSAITDCLADGSGALVVNSEYVAHKVHHCNDDVYRIYVKGFEQ